MPHSTFLRFSSLGVTGTYCTHCVYTTRAQYRSRPDGILNTTYRLHSFGMRHCGIGLLANRPPPPISFFVRRLRLTPPPPHIPNQCLVVMPSEHVHTLVFSYMEEGLRWVVVDYVVVAAVVPRFILLPCVMLPRYT